LAIEDQGQFQELLIGTSITIDVSGECMEWRSNYIMLTWKLTFHNCNIVTARPRTINQFKLFLSWVGTLNTIGSIPRVADRGSHQTVGWSGLNLTDRRPAEYPEAKAAYWVSYKMAALFWNALVMLSAEISQLLKGNATMHLSIPSWNLEPKEANKTDTWDKSRR
jgi:hypothetical protein